MLQSEPSDYAPSRRRFLKVLGAGYGVGALLPSVAAGGEKDDFPSLPRLRAAHEKQGIISPMKTYRTMEWEFHTPPEEKFDINWEAAVKAARDSGAESMMFYSQDHRGIYSGMKWLWPVNWACLCSVTTACSSTTSAF
jgi:hypothetical protein